MNVLSLFSGIGGLDLGFRAAFPAARTVAYVESDAFCQRVLTVRMLDGRLDSAGIWPDVSTFDGRPWLGHITAIIGGFPCQDASLAGKRAGIDGRRTGLWREYARIIREVRPAIVFVENVPGLLSAGFGRVLGDLAALGFDAEWVVLGADEIGAPHRRDRVFLLAYADRRRRELVGREGVLHRERPAPRNDADGRNCASASLAYATDQRHERRGPSRRRGDGSSDDGDTLADPIGAGLEIRREQHAWPEREAVERSGGPVWPPGPDDAAGWGRYLAVHPGNAPTVESAVRRGAHGATSRVDRLHALGNAVVPTQAARALEILWSRP